MPRNKRAVAMILMLAFALAFGFSAAYEVATADIGCHCQCDYYCPQSGLTIHGTKRPTCNIDSCQYDLACDRCTPL